MLVQIKPTIQHESNCPYCGTTLEPASVLWLGMFTCTTNKACAGCRAKIIEDLKIGHAVNYSYQIDLEKGRLFGNTVSEDWLGKPLLKSLQNPQDAEVRVLKEVLKPYKQVVILNCIDFLYGHCLLKLLNAQRHLEEHSDYGLIIVMQEFLRWMVPEGVAEVWTVDIPLRNGQNYYTKFEKFVYEESKRFDEIYVSEAYSHLSKFNVTNFTKVPKYDFIKEEFKITFVWREDRIWCNLILRRFLRKFATPDLALLIQNWRLQNLFEKIRCKVPSARFVVVGLGKKTKFPEWIEDLRVDGFDENTERKICHIYSESYLVLGVHGSNMLLPSGHAGMSIDLVPNGKKERWRNFADDILYHETDPRLAAFRYRYVSFGTSITELAQICSSMILKYSEFKLYMMADK